MPGLFAGTPLERPVTCEHCSRPVAECGCPRGASGRAVLPKDQSARVRRERRRGKITTVIAGLDPGPGGVAGVRAASSPPSVLAKELRSLLATGGSVSDDGEIELQGDHRDRVLELLRSRGYPAKAAGG